MSDRDRYTPKTPPAGVRAQSMHGIPVDEPDEITGRYDGEELERRRSERSARARERLATLEAQAKATAEEIRSMRSDLRINEKLVDNHNVKLELNVMPAITKLPRELEAIRLAQGQLDQAFESAIANTNDAIAGIAIQLREQHEQIDDIAKAHAETTTRVAAVETAQAATAAEIVKLKRIRAETITDAKVGSWVRRHAIKIVIGVLATLGGLVVGYLSKALGIGVSP